VIDIPPEGCQLRVQGIYVGSREMFEEMNRTIAQFPSHPPP
jgi:hypothetical protein